MREEPYTLRLGRMKVVALVSRKDHEWASKHLWYMLPATGYVYRFTSRRTVVLLHREILGLQAGDPRQSDHINRDRLDCRRENLRIVTVAENNQNMTPRKGGTSRYRGVSWDKRSRRWVVQVSANGRRYYTSSKDEDEAGRLARELRLEHMPYAID